MAQATHPVCRYMATLAGLGHYISTLAFEILANSESKLIDRRSNNNSTSWLISWKYNSTTTDGKYYWLKLGRHGKTRVERHGAVNELWYWCCCSTTQTAVLQNISERTTGRLFSRPAVRVIGSRSFATSVRFMSLLLKSLHPSYSQSYYFFRSCYYKLVLMTMNVIAYRP